MITHNNLLKAGYKVPVSELPQSIFLQGTQLKARATEVSHLFLEHIFNW